MIKSTYCSCRGNEMGSSRGPSMPYVECEGSNKHRHECMQNIHTLMETDLFCCAYIHVNHMYAWCPLLSEEGVGSLGLVLDC